MLRAYETEKVRLEAIRAYRRLVVHSQYMHEEYKRHGIPSTVVPLPPPAIREAAPRRFMDAGRQLTVLYLGRLYDLKGCAVLLDAAAIASRQFSGLRLFIAGDGQELEALQRQSRAIARTAPNLIVRFLGHVDARRRDDLLSTADVLAVPSIWPEPYGMVGLEAAAYGVPAVAFDVGGIPEWLRDGVSGVLAKTHTQEGLASALIACAEDAAHYSRLSGGARSVYEELVRRDTVRTLEEVFAEAAASVKALRLQRNGT